MQLGLIGLGRMGANMARRLMKAGHKVSAFDVNAGAVDALARDGATGAKTLEALVQSLAQPRVIWLMVPAGIVDREVDALAKLLASGDAIVDGGNSHYHDDLRRAARLRPAGIHYVDAGVSGGVWGAERGYCLMIGGEKDVVERLDPIFSTLAPGIDAAPKTPSRKTNGTAERGYLHCGPVGAGHFVKMVHNGIEYGLMAAYAEGLNILRHANAGATAVAADAETAPLEQPDLYRYHLNIADVTEVWRRGSVISSWLLDLTADALAQDPALAQFSGRVSDSGEGRWTLAAAVDTGVPAHVLAAAVFDRFSSQGQSDFANRLLSAMRYEFGGHQEKK